MSAAINIQAHPTPRMWAATGTWTPIYPVAVTLLDEAGAPLLDEAGQTIIGE